MQDAFELARRCITPSYIQSFFTGRPVDIRQDELWTTNPLRNDKTIGSFHVNLNTGCWVDHADGSGGDFIDLYSKVNAITPLEAAKKIANIQEVITQYFTENHLEYLNKYMNSSFLTEKYGQPVTGWKYEDSNGVWLCVIRYEKDGKKSIIPFTIVDGKIKATNNYHDNRKLFNINKLKKGDKVLIVEGEKCASVNIDGYILITWLGGTGQVKKSNWKVFKNYDVTIWHDNDEPGEKARDYIKSELPNAKLIKVENKPEGWDIADAEKEGIDLVKFIEDSIIIEETEIEPEFEQQNDSEMFRFLGYDDTNHYFLSYRSNTIEKISKGSVSKQRLIELAPLCYWQFKYPAKSQDGVDWTVAMDDIINCSSRLGFFNIMKVRGVGIWKNNEKIIINDGNKCIDKNGNRADTKKSENFYVRSNKIMNKYDMKRISTNEEGKELYNLIEAQRWENSLDIFSIMGWSLIAPYAGILSWRPHIWITGESGGGKSFILENMVVPLVGAYSFTGNGSDTVPGIMRSIEKDPIPVIKDEMEVSELNIDGKGKIEKMLEMMRNASCDSSAVTTMGRAGGGTDTYITRSCFCFASIMSGTTKESQENRIAMCRLKRVSDVNEKIENTKKYSHVMLNYDKYRNRMLYEIDNVIENIKILKKILTEITGNMRLSEVYAPLIAACYAVMEGGIIESGKEIHFKSVCEKLFKNKLKNEISLKDENRVLDIIFEHIIREGQETFTIGGLLNNEYLSDEEVNILGKYGIKKQEINGEMHLIICKNHSQISEMLKKTNYDRKYHDILKRHAAYSFERKIRFEGIPKYAIGLKWSGLPFSEVDI